METDGDLTKAAALYEKAIKQEPFDEEPWNRLMVIYRKLKRYEDEERVITRAIKVFKEHYGQRQERILGQHTKAEEISRALLRSVQGKRGRQRAEPDYPPPIPKWAKRLEVVEKKLGK